MERFQWQEEDTRQQRQVAVELHPLTLVLVEVVIFDTLTVNSTVFRISYFLSANFLTEQNSKK